MKGSLIIVSFFVLGIIVGLCDVIPAGLLDSDVSYYALCCLMFCVGGEEDGKYLLFAGRELVRHELFAYLIEADLVGCAHDGLND